MVDGDLGQAILQGIERLNARFDGVDARFDGVDARLDRVEARLDRVEARLDGVEARLDRVEARLAKLEVETTSLGERVTSLEHVVADIDVRLRSWPDMHFLAAAANAQLANAKDLKDYMFETKTRLKEIYQTMATDPEIDALRADVSHFRDQSVDIEVRLATVEGHLGIKPIRPPR